MNLQVPDWIQGILKVYNDRAEAKYANDVDAFNTRAAQWVTNAEDDLRRGIPVPAFVTPIPRKSVWVPVAPEGTFVANNYTETMADPDPHIKLPTMPVVDLPPAPAPLHSGGEDRDNQLFNLLSAILVNTEQIKRKLEI